MIGLLVPGLSDRLTVNLPTKCAHDRQTSSRTLDQEINMTRRIRFNLGTIKQCQVSIEPLIAIHHRTKNMG